MRDLLFDSVMLSFSELLESPDPLLRLNLVHGLAEEADPASLPLLVKALDDPDMAVRMAAAYGVMNIMPDVIDEPDMALIPVPQMVH